MTVTAPLHAALDRQRRRRSIWIGSVLTSTVVATGSAVACWALPDVPTPDNVVRAFFEADHAEDWATTWAMTCQKTRDQIGGYTAYMDGLAYLRDERDSHANSYAHDDLDLEIDGVHVFMGPSGPSATVWIRWVYDDGRLHQESSADVLVVKEGAETRVCNEGSWMP